MARKKSKFIRLEKLALVRKISNLHFDNPNTESDACLINQDVQTVTFSIVESEGERATISIKSFDEIISEFLS